MQDEGQGTARRWALGGSRPGCLLCGRWCHVERLGRGTERLGVQKQRPPAAERGGTRASCCKTLRGRLESPMSPADSANAALKDAGAGAVTCGSRQKSRPKMLFIACCESASRVTGSVALSAGTAARRAANSASAAVAAAIRSTAPAAGSVKAPSTRNTRWFAMPHAMRRSRRPPRWAKRRR